MNERRYTDQEVEEIFRAAALPAARTGEVSAANGLSLAELQSIGREVGVSPEGIAEAAARLDARTATHSRRSVLRVPIAVGRTLDLPRTTTDREWAILVAELREIFQAHGRESTSPESRSWRNGNLHVVIEPTEAGSRLRMGTRKSDAPAIAGMGLFFALMAVLMLFTEAGGSTDIFPLVFFALMAVGTLSYTAVRLPRWASERNEQMDHVADRVLELLNRPPDGSPPGDV